MGNKANKIVDKNTEMAHIAYAPKILMLGYTAATACGKTSLLRMLNREIFRGEITWHRPTPRLQVQVVNYNGLQITCFSIGCSRSMYPLYNQFMKNAKALIWVVDSTDGDRIGCHTDGEYFYYSSCSELHYILNHFRDDFDGIPILILANKQDRKNALSVAEVQKELNLMQRVGITPDMFMDIGANTLLDMLPKNIFDVLCEYSEHNVCSLPGPRIIPSDLNQKGMITCSSNKKARVIRRIHLIICEYLPPYDTWQNRTSKCKIFGCSNHGYLFEGALEGFEWLMQNIKNERRNTHKCVLL